MKKGQGFYQVLFCVTRIVFSFNQWGDHLLLLSMAHSKQETVMYMLPWALTSILKWQNQKQTELKWDM